MIYRHYLSIPLLGMSLASPLAFSQENELDITIRVMNDNEAPGDFVQRLELPTPASLGIPAPSDTSANITLDEEVARTSDTIAETANESEAVSINSIIDNISIDGAGAEASVENAGNLPNQVVDILDDNLPLNDDLTDTVDDTTGEIVDVLGNNLDESTGDLVGDVTDDIDDSVDEASDDIVENTDDAVGEITDNVSDSTNNVDDDIVDAVDNTGSDIGSTLDDVSDTGNNDDMTTELDTLSQSLEQDSVEAPQSLTNDL